MDSQECDSFVRRIAIPSWEVDESQEIRESARQECLSLLSDVELLQSEKEEAKRSSG
jgi:hypothetical protein